MTMGDEEIKPGTKLTVRGTDYVAVDLHYLGTGNLNCANCAFNDDDRAQSASDCMNTECRGVVWMTPIKLITLRITK